LINTSILSGEPVHAVEVEIDEQLRLVVVEQPADEIDWRILVAEWIDEREQRNQTVLGLSE
jgi:hypothetical protein